MYLFKYYFLDFFIWWYYIEGIKVVKKMIADWSFVLAYLNLVPMITNLFTPLFQDNSWEGKLVAVPFRLGWVIVGGIVLMIYTLIAVLGTIAYFLLPLAPIVSFIVFTSLSSI